jgi:hypothetical protein
MTRNSCHNIYIKLFFTFRLQNWSDAALLFLLFNTVVPYDDSFMDYNGFLTTKHRFNLLTYSVDLVANYTTERPPLVGEVSANFCG